MTLYRYGDLPRSLYILPAYPRERSRIRNSDVIMTILMCLTNYSGNLSRNLAAGVFILLWVGIVNAQHLKYHILKGGDKIGSIDVSHSVEGEHEIYRMYSRSVFSLFWKQRVNTKVVTEYSKGMLIGCNSSVTLNGSLRDSSNMEYHHSGSILGYVHPGKVLQLKDPGPWTTARMYFEEPIGALSIFVESVLKDCPLEHTGEGRYTLTFPNNTKNHYVYDNGALLEVYVIRPFVDLIFRRV